MMLNDLKDISFCNTSATTVEADMITTYEALSGKKLYPGDPVRLFLQSLAQIIIQQRIVIDFSAKQNLLKYATGNYLDQVVAMVGVKRLEASAAKCTIKFTISAAQTSILIIPKGTRVKAGDVYFSTIEDTYINPGELGKEVVVECLNSGSAGNNFMPGQINEIVDTFPYFQSVTNISATSGGSEIESDEALRERAFDAPSSYSTAGSDEAYAFWAKSVSASIGDVAVISEAPGEISIIPIGKDGALLSDEIMDEVLAKCTDKNVKPLTDKVSVIQPTIVEYTINVQYYISRDKVPMGTVIQTQVQKAIDEYIRWQNGKLGRDINPSELMYKIMQAGAKRVSIASPVFAVIKDKEIAKVKSVNIQLGGIEDE
ncbi:MAG: baseplate J/gp47 family protein [Cellulosilyticaceae bacterium]